MDKNIPIIEKLNTKILSNSDFPAMGRTVALVNKQTSSESDVSVTELANTILNDYALSNKLLKMVNTVFYIKYQLDGKINTISRAVYVLGFNQVRNAALSLMLFEHISNKATAYDLREGMVMSFMTALIAREVAKQTDVEDVEAAFLCAFFHDLGKLLTIFYLPEEFLKIKEILAKDPSSEEAAVLSVLGTKFEKIGAHIAKSWHFSADIIYCMETSSQSQHSVLTQLDKLRCLTGFSSKICSITYRANQTPEVWAHSITSLLKSYKGCIDLKEEDVITILESSFKETLEYAKNFKFGINDSKFLKRLSFYLTHMGSSISCPEEVITKEKQYEDIGGISLLEIHPGDADDVVDDNPEAILMKGVQEIANTLLENYNLNDVLRMILEVLFRGFKFHRVIICIRNSKDSVMEGRFGFGPDLGKIGKSFKFALDKDSDDVFNLSLTQGVDILISDISDNRIVSKIPAWFTNLVDAQTFVLIPIIVLKTPIGLIYAEKQKANEISISQQLLRFIKTLRNQAVLAIKQRM
ncbi:HDOD domain-containing protein [Candidatus Magnetomonas plexicatena]|uniref:HDOD domain-containing protein n=1 Tax=Candidatus Magnetomonas plexicatena TaxID=2552947 RepID=UPI001C74B24F|nr:HDOD domain-containing protein [Nitrospirales bacterium LBB_01]